MKTNIFTWKAIRTKTHPEQEAHDNSEMAYIGYCRLAWRVEPSCKFGQINHRAKGMEIMSQNGFHESFQIKILNFFVSNSQFDDVCMNFSLP